jgi:hypothetical protein
VNFQHQVRLWIGLVSAVLRCSDGVQGWFEPLFDDGGPSDKFITRKQEARRSRADASPAPGLELRIMGCTQVMRAKKLRMTESRARLP